MPPTPGLAAATVSAFIPGELKNPKNMPAWGLWKHRRYVRTWRKRAQQHLLAASCAFPSRRWPWAAATPKRVEFVVNVGREWDDDGLAFGLVPVRDAVRDMGLVDDDAPRCGHEFRYRQQVRTPRGVRITVTLR